MDKAKAKSKTSPKAKAKSSPKAKAKSRATRVRRTAQKSKPSQEAKKTKQSEEERKIKHRLASKRWHDRFVKKGVPKDQANPDAVPGESMPSSSAKKAKRNDGVSKD